MTPLARSLPMLMLLAVFAACTGTEAGAAAPIPGGSTGIGFDDLRYSPTLHAVLAPGGRAGVLAMIDADTRAVTTVSGLTTSESYDGSHDVGATSVDEGRGLLFVTDRTTQELHVIDPKARTILSSLSLSASPDYVRYVAATNEVWISEPSGSQLEIISLGNDAAATPRFGAVIPVDNGPESLVIDQRAGRAYTHRWQSTTLVFDVRTRALVSEWPNGCAASRGLAVDEARGFFFAGCSEGTLSVLDAAHDGHVLSSIARGAGYDVIGYNPSLGHVYLAGTACRCLVVLGVSATGQLGLLGRFDAENGSHCAVADDRGHAWVCDPDGGQLWRIDDPYPVSF